MNIALIFAGGTGQRMNTRSKPKQFLELHNKPIIIYTIEQFESHDEIDEIIVVCLEQYIDYLRSLTEKYSIKKVSVITKGGESGIHSIFNGLKVIRDNHQNNPCVLVHDGVRPLVDHETISLCIESVNRSGNAVTVVPAIETVLNIDDNGNVNNIMNRNKCQLARAPQCFRLNELFDCYARALNDGPEQFIDSASIMQHYGHTLHTVPGKMENIKITTPMDYYLFRALVDAREDSQIFGV